MDSLEPILRELEADLAKYKGLSAVMFWVSGDKLARLCAAVRQTQKTEEEEDKAFKIGIQRYVERNGCAPAIFADDPRTAEEAEEQREEVRKALGLYEYTELGATYEDI